MQAKWDSIEYIDTQFNASIYFIFKMAFIINIK